MQTISKRLIELFICTFFALCIGSAQAESQQTNVNQAKHMVDEHGIPQLSIDGVGKVYHPAWAALYALAYAGVEDYDPSLGLKADPQRFSATIDWLKANLLQNDRGLWVWPYGFDSTYNDVSIKAPWSSAFAQATGIQALLAHWKQTGDKSSLQVARKAAEALFVPLQDGGFLFSSGDDIWFEEIPEPIENPSHILNGHMRALLALSELSEATGDDSYKQWFKKGSDSLLHWLPRYDAGYWLRYDLNPRKEELLFRLANPYGFANPEVAIDRIVLRDPESGKESVLDVGSANDAEGPLRIAGNDWGPVEQLDGRSVRRLRPAAGERETQGSDGQMVAPYSYFYLTLPSEWQDNLREGRFELSVEYLDEKPGNLEVQIRSISAAPETFKSLQDGDLLVSGSGAWRKWNVPVKPRDLGYWVGETYARKHAEYLSKLSQRDARFTPWAETAVAYLQAMLPGADYEVVTPKKVELPQQTPMLPIYSLDKNGVLLQHLATAGTKFDQKGMYDPASGDGMPVYSPYIIASQLIQGPDTPGAAYSKIKKEDIQRAPALAWFKDKENKVDLGGAVTYLFPFPNVYNDVATASGWPSAFSQAYVLKAFEYTYDNLEKTDDIKNLISAVGRAYSISVDVGGISTVSKSGLRYYEEVPNATHVLNAHLISVPELDVAADRIGDKKIKSLADEGVETLREKLSQFDTGYWMRYDLNPKKEILFQIDWLSGDTSPLIENIRLEAPQFSKKIELNVGSEKAFDGSSRITGLEWASVQLVDGRQVRAFSNGYLAHEEAVKGGTRHNVYALMDLPEGKFNDYFDVRSHRLVVRYKDIAVGKFVIKAQSINEGGVLDFTPLRNAVITTVGDQQWKEAVIEVRPQDMGWYKGADYQVYEVEQLGRIAKLSGDWFFAQYQERQRYFLDAKAKGQSVIVQPVYKPSVESVELSVIESSATYDGFGFENALDGDPNDDYVAGQESEKKSSVVLRLDRAIKNGVLGLRWESRANYAGELKIFAVSADDHVQEMVSKVLLDGDDLTVELKSEKPFSKLRIDFSKFSGQPRILLRLIDVKEDVSKRAKEGVVSKGGGGVFMSEVDDMNPLKVFRKSISLDIKNLSDKLSEGAVDEEAKISSFMSYIGGYEVGFPHGASLDEAVKSKVGHCGSFTELLVGLAAAQNISGRVYYLYNYPVGSGHVIAELKVGGRWQVYDPTYGAHYYIKGRPGRKLSFNEIVSSIKSGEEVEVKISLQRFGAEQYTSKEIFLKSDPIGLVDPNVAMTFPLNMRSGDRFSYVKGTPEFAQLLGGDLIGAGYVNQQQYWDVQDLSVGKSYSFRVFVSDVVGGEEFKLDLRLENGAEIKKSHHVFSINNDENSEVKLNFKAQSPRVRIHLGHGYKGPAMHYINVERYELVSL